MSDDPVEKEARLAGKILFGGWLERRFIPVLIRITESLVIIAIKDAVLSSLPVIIAGSAIFFFFPIHQELLQRILDSFIAGLGAMAIFISFLLAKRLSQAKGLSKNISGLASAFVFFLSFPPFELTLSGIYDLFYYLAQGGLFLAIFLSITVVELDAIIFHRLYPLETRASSAEIISKGASLLIHVLIILYLAWSGHLLPGLIYQAIQPLMNAGDSLPWVIVILFCMCLLWLVGVHGAMIIGVVITPVYLVLIKENFAAFASHQPLPNVVTPPFFHFALLGGSGATLPLSFFMLNSPSQKLKKLGRISLLPGLCNVNETLIYGVPLVMNPIMALPFLLGPLILGTVNYLAMYFNLVGRIFIYTPPLLPVPVSMYLATGGDLRTLVLALVDILIVFVLNYPFYKTYEKQVLREESGMASRSGNPRIAPL